jgi:septal ring factor EnvC (AmiA/AmiB activator)
MEHVNPAILRDVLLILMSMIVAAGGVIRIVQSLRQQRRDVRLEDVNATRDQVEDLAARTRDDLAQLRQDMRSIETRLHRVEAEMGEIPAKVIALLRNTGVIK